MYVRRDHTPSRREDYEDSEVCPILYSLLQIFSKKIVIIVIVTENQVAAEWRYSEGDEDNIFEKLLCEKKNLDLNLESNGDNLSLLTLSPNNNKMKNPRTFLLQKDSSISHITRDILLNEGKSSINILQILPVESADSGLSVARKFIEGHDKNHNKSDKTKKGTSNKNDTDVNGGNDDKMSQAEESSQREMIVSALSNGYIGLMKIFSSIDPDILETLYSNSPRERGSRTGTGMEGEATCSS